MPAEEVFSHHVKLEAGARGKPPSWKWRLGVEVS
jgi:hypothetical protein